MERVIITTAECGKVVLPGIPSKNVWISESELVELSGVVIPTLRAVVGTVYKGGALKEYEVQKYVCLENGCYADMFGSPMITILAFRISGLGAEQVREAIFERLCLRKEKTSIFLSLVSNNMDSFNYQAQSLLKWRHEVVKFMCTPIVDNVFIRITA